ncbi:fibronectin type III-like domain-contianing protein [[Kitasatospora] papulosa]|uniref:fibronectin type III-like domain-contianing protein n=1 Tax=[Kitasatospora] papulosa TaxID=1464011 RepID=UPI00382CEFFB
MRNQPPGTPGRRSSSPTATGPTSTRATGAGQRPGTEPRTRPCTELVQLYTNDPVAQLPRPVTELTGFTRVALTAGEERHITFRPSADRPSHTGPHMWLIVEPGEAPS